MANRAMTIDLIVVDSYPAAFALRSVLEYWGIRVHIHIIASANQLVELLSTPEQRAPWIIIECHGIVEGLALPALAPEIEAAQQYHHSLSASNLHEFLRLPGALVINTGCSLGTPAFATAFLDAGCQAYIGATDDPYGNAALFYVLHLFYGLVCQQKPLAEAHLLAQSHDESTAIFAMYTP
jgi:hypothetical protein